MTRRELPKLDAAERAWCEKVKTLCLSNAADRRAFVETAIAWAQELFRSRYGKDVDGFVLPGDQKRIIVRAIKNNNVLRPYALLCSAVSYIVDAASQIHLESKKRGS